MAAGYYTTSTAFLEALAEAGVRYLFANLGSDHPGIIEALAQARDEGREPAFPRLIVCPHETVALSAAHAYASVSRTPQAVLVHVDAGTQNMGGAVSTAMRGRCAKRQSSACSWPRSICAIRVYTAFGWIVWPPGSVAGRPQSTSWRSPSHKLPRRR